MQNPFAKLLKLKVEEEQIPERHSLSAEHGDEEINFERQVEVV